jgi:hypothetical protein
MDDDDTPTDAVCVEYYGGINDPIIKVRLFGGKRWFNDGWVYRLDGEVMLIDEQAVQPIVLHYDDVLVYVIEGVIMSASELSFWDREHRHEYTWDDLEKVLNHEFADDRVVASITDEECQYAMHVIDDNDDDDDSSYSSYSSF